MCKVFGVAGVSKKNRGDVIELIKKVTPLISTIEKDGFGYAAITETGHIFGEKWLHPKDAWEKRIKRKNKPAYEIPDIDKPLVDKLGPHLVNSGMPQDIAAPPVYDSFGHVELGTATAFIMHSRYSTITNSTSIENVHPFHNAGTALVHNGIVYNDEQFHKSFSDCDSEILLHQYNNYIVNMDPKALEYSLQDVEAYLACLVLSQEIDNNENMTPILDLYKHDADLYAIHIHDLDVTTFCTSKYAVVQACKALGWSTSRPMAIKDNVLLRFNAITGELMLAQDFNYNGGRQTKWVKDETYLKSRYGDDWEKHSDELDVNNSDDDESEDLSDDEVNARLSKINGDYVDYNDPYTSSYDKDWYDERDPFYDGSNVPTKAVSHIMRRHARTSGWKY